MESGARARPVENLEGVRRPVTQGSLGTGLGYAGTRTAVQGSGLARWKLDALA